MLATIRPENLSRLDWLADQATDEEVGEFLAGLNAEELLAMTRGDWEYIARPAQLAPIGEWTHWLVMAGRGFGKTRAGAGFIHQRVKAGECKAAALIGATAADVRDVMVEGPSGILATAYPGLQPHYEPSKRRITWPNGAVATTYSADEPERLRGPQHDTAWCDEPGTWRRGVETRDNFLLGFRMGSPRAVWTTTPRNMPLIKAFVADAQAHRRGVVLTGGSTYDNEANLAAAYLEEVTARYEGTRLGRQELYAELLDDLGSIFRRSWFKLIVSPEPNPVRVRFWDLAATAEGEGNEDPDWTAGALVSYDPVARTYCIEDIRRTRGTAGQVEALLAQTAAEDGKRVRIGIEQEPGASGKALIAHYKLDVLAGYQVNQGAPELYRPTGPKEARASLVAGPAEQELVTMVLADWTTALLDELEEFPVGTHDDQVDALSGAFGMLRAASTRWTASELVPGGSAAPSYWRSV